MIKTRFAAAALALGLSAATVSAPAFAEEVTVSYKDLNLASADGQKTLDRRISKAAKKVCGYDELQTGTRIRSISATACYLQAMQQTKQQVAALVEDARLGG